MSKKKKRIIIATIRPWNIAAAKWYKKICRTHCVELITSKRALTVARVKEIDPEIIFFPHWSWKIPSGIHRAYTCIGFHMTDLPYGRGGSPLQNLIVRKHTKTKVTAFDVTDSMDEGRIYCKREVSLSGSACDIFHRVSELIFKKMIPYIVSDRPTPKAQRGKPVVFKRLDANAGDITQCTTVAEIYDRIRMLDADGYPPAFLESNSWRFDFTQAQCASGIITAQVTIRKRK